MNRFRIAWAWTGFGVALGILAMSVEQSGVVTALNGLLVVCAITAAATGLAFIRSDATAESH